MTDVAGTGSPFQDGGTTPLATVHTWADGENSHLDLAWACAGGFMSFGR